MVLPICSSCCPVGQCPSMRRLGALPIVILERFLRLDCVVTRKNFSRQGASATTMSPKEDKPSCRHRRVWLTRWRRTSVWLAMMVTGEDLQDWTPVEQERKVSSSRWGKVAVRGRAAVLGNFQAPMCRRVSEVQLKSVVGTRETDVERPRAVDKGEFLDALVGD